MSGLTHPLVDSPSKLYQLHGPAPAPAAIPASWGYISPWGITSPRGSYISPLGSYISPWGAISAPWWSYISPWGLYQPLGSGNYMSKGLSH